MNFYILIDDNEDVKIGITKNIKTRLKNIRNGNPNNVQIYHIEEREDALIVEQEMKKKLKKYKKNGEWYKGVSPLEIRKMLLDM